MASRDIEEEEEEEEEEPSVIDLSGLSHEVVVKSEESQEILLNETNTYVSSIQKEGIESVYDQ